MLGRRKKRIAGRRVIHKGTVSGDGMALPGDVLQEHGGITGKSRRENEIEKARQDIMLACLEASGTHEEDVEIPHDNRVADEVVSDDVQMSYRPTDAERATLLSDIDQGKSGDNGQKDTVFSENTELLELDVEERVAPKEENTGLPGALGGWGLPGKYYRSAEGNSFVAGIMNQIVAFDIEQHCRRIRERSK